MNFGYDSVIGILAAFLTTLSFVPQIIKAYHTKRMKDVSRYLMILFTTGSILWIVYGVLHEDLVIIGANTTAATFNLILLYYSFVYSVST
jgi:MtN3 and saliva related transmembrane protein